MDILTIGSLAFLGLAPVNLLPLTQSDVPQLSLEKEVEKTIPFLTNEEDEIELEVPFVHQFYDLPEDRKREIQWSACGPTSLTMAFLYNGSDTSLIEVIDNLPSSVYIKGNQFYNLKKGAELYDFEAVTVEKNAKGIYGALKEGNPVILNVQNYQGYIGHAMVVTGIKGYNAETGTAVSLIIHDPVGGESQEFKFVGPTTLEQPEGYLNYMGTLDPFYLKKKE